MDLGLWSASELVESLRAKRVSSVELLDEYLARIEKLNPAVNAVVTLDAERARAQAAAADAASVRGDLWGPLHGLPVSVKDAIDTAGLRTTGGSKDFASRVPEHDAPVVARLKGAGAVVFAKTNLPLWSGDGQTWNELFGATANPWDLERAPGGSSGGAAAAVACGLAALETGTDIGGSIRNPAHFTGVYGHKPSFGLVPGTGYFDRPDGGHVDVDINVIGPLARSVDDLELSMNQIAGPDPLGARRPQFVLPAPRATTLDGYRIALWLDDPTLVVDREVRAILRRAADTLADAGAHIDEAHPDIDVEHALRTYFFLLGAAMGSGDEQTVAIGRSLRDAPPEIADRIDLSFARGAVAEMADWNAARVARAAVRREWARFHERYDALLCPVVPTAALPTEPGVPIGDRTMPIDGEPRPAVNMILWCGLIGLAYLPSTVIPVGATATGLPVGMQVVGPYLEDRTALDVARRGDRVLGAYRVPPLARLA
jgi:amidase